jgi:riboflavin kinase/FMN adenylyltransferase
MDTPSIFKIIKLKESSHSNSNSRAIALGMFDGLHLGHQSLINRVVGFSKNHNLTPTAITFAEPPIKWLKPSTEIQLISTLEERIEYFKTTDICELIVMDFPKLQNLSAEEYLNSILLNELKAKFITCGINHHFGKNQEGNSNSLSVWCKANSIDFEVSEPIKDKQGQVISSSLVRQALKEGNLNLVQNLMNHNFIIIGKIEKGKSLGSKIGFPTLNIPYAPDKVKIPLGVYLALSSFGGQTYKSIVNIGKAPTIHGEERSIFLESHILENFPSDSSYELLKVELLKFMRPEKKFNSLDSLVSQIQSDCKDAREYFAL